MESRKVQKVGYSTLSVSLPSEWTREVDLKRGDTIVFMPEKDGSLKLLPNKLLEPKKEIEEYIIDSDLCDDPKMLERIIVGNYILGRDLFSVVSSERISSEHIEEIRRIMRKLIGLGIVEETSDRITLQCSVDPRKFHLDMLLRRLSVIALTIEKEAVQALVDFAPSLAKDAISREDEADMMFWLAMRLLFSAQRSRAVAQEIGLTEPLHILYFGLMLKYLELIADYSEEIAKGFLRLHACGICKDALPEWALKRISNLGDLAHDVVLKSVDCFFIGDIKIANSILEMLTFIEKEREKLTQELPEIPYVRCIAWNLTRIADNGAGIALIAINKVLEKKTRICSKRW